MIKTYVTGTCKLFKINCNTKSKLKIFQLIVLDVIISKKTLIQPQFSITNKTLRKKIVN